MSDRICFELSQTPTKPVSLFIGNATSCICAGKMVKYCSTQ